MAFAAQQCTISLERFTPSGEFTSEVSSGLTITQSRSPIVEKPPLSLVDGITSLGSAPTLERSYDTTFSWQAQATLNMTFKTATDVARAVISIAKDQRDTPISLRLATGTNFSGWYGVARPQIGGAPSPATPTDLAQIELTFEGQSYLRLMPPVV